MLIAPIPNPMIPKNRERIPSSDFISIYTGREQGEIVWQVHSVTCHRTSHAVGIFRKQHVTMAGSWFIAHTSWQSCALVVIHLPPHSAVNGFAFGRNTFLVPGKFRTKPSQNSGRNVFLEACEFRTKRFLEFRTKHILGILRMQDETFSEFRTGQIFGALHV